MRNLARFALVFSLVSLAAPLPVGAGAALTTAHKLAITLRGISQGQTNAGDQRMLKDVVGARDIFEVCTGAPPTRTQGIYLFLSCSDLNANEIIAIDTNPLDGLAAVGSIQFDLAHRVQVTKNAKLKSESIPVEISLTCDDSTVQLRGVMNLRYAPLGPLDCVHSATVRVSGVGFSPAPGDFIVNDGSAIAVQPRSPTITTPPNL